ncbi:Zinc finger BED domain-containing protein 5-like 27 [Homarus americanus]|uniref:Zinc finger BED domain-containing protein 5-like 27 n=1 Tax=Homarus americanus TaxID=6706 RepID=A0A8J5JXW0_HOMAM|nr:Zinc finger BED domain-containing protein 5-like 27 [Homarus americanus]
MAGDECFVLSPPGGLVYYEPKTISLLSLAYLVDIFEALNALNLKLQGKNINIIMHHDTIRTFMAKLDLWKCRIQQGNTASFSNLDSALIHSNLDSELKKQIITHLTD